MITDFKYKHLLSVIAFLIFGVCSNIYLNSIRTDNFDYTGWGLVLLSFSIITAILYVVDVFILKSVDIIDELKQKNIAVAIVIAAILISAAIIL